jgi:hypothetical protein
VAFEGAAVFIQRPDDATWYLSGFVSQRATIGYTTDALATVADPTVFDTTNDVNIQLYSEASLSTVTAAEVEIGRNLALIGTEVVGFRDAVLESDGTYTLDYLWRGAMATEDTVGDHVAFERFVVLDSNVGFVPINREDEGTVLSIKVVPPGATTDDVPTISHTVTLATCKPLPPADVTLTAVGNTLKADWTYRSLRAARFRDPTYAPREPGERIAIRYYNTTLASATTAVEEVEVDAALETYTLPTPYDAGLTASDISAEVVVVSDTFGESVAPGDDLGSAAFVTIAPVEYAEIDYVDGTSQAASSGPVTVAATDKVVPIDATSGAITVNLPPAASAKRLVTIVKVDSSVNLVTIDADGSETIDGATTRTLSTQWASVNLISDGTEWFTA